MGLEDIKSRGLEDIKSRLRSDIAYGMIITLMRVNLIEKEYHKWIELFHAIRRSYPFMKEDR